MSETVAHQVAYLDALRRCLQIADDEAAYCRLGELCRKVYLRQTGVEAPALPPWHAVQGWRDPETGGPEAL
jgi:hypothetical protein